MIFYYSATGNSRFAAERLAELLCSEAIDMLSPGAAAADFDPAGGVGFVFPIYCWGVPPVVSSFISSLAGRLSEDMYVWAACTCGDEAGKAMRCLSTRLERLRGRGADALFSVIMPNTYVLLPGFDVDRPEVAEEKLRLAPSRLEAVAAAVKSGRSGICDVTEGSMPALRSMIFPVFEKWGVFPRYWHSTDACIGCGKCAAICPARNIEMRGRRPVWGSRCFSCCACFHVCPVKAVEYGSITRGKGRYLFPGQPLSRS